MKRDVETIAKLNDAFRATFLGGAVLITDGVHALGHTFVANALSAVQRFNAFDKGNDPRSEHDFGAVEIDGETIFFKIDCYDVNLEYGSLNPADPITTRRVMTIMLAQEY